MMRHRTTEKSRLILSLVLGMTTLGTTLGTTIEQASALPLPLIEGLVAPIGSLLTGGQQRPPQPTDLQLMNGNLNNNSLNLCALTCGPSAGASGMPGSPSVGTRPAGLPGLPGGIPMISGGQMIPGGQPIPGGQVVSGRQVIPGGQMMPNGQVIPGRSPFPTAPQAMQAQQSSNPVLQLPPIQLPNPF